jgi:enoyl-CoA hydratase/carnithine racemase
MTSAPDLSHRTVIEERVAAVALITLDRPERLNAWSDEMGERYRDLLTAADADPEVRAIVETGAGSWREHGAGRVHDRRDRWDLRLRRRGGDVAHRLGPHDHRCP